MKVVCISDTHGTHKNLDLPNGDLIIHSGDFSAKLSSMEECRNFIDWYSLTNFKYKILIAGNHDCCLDPKKMQYSLEIPNMLTYIENKGIIYLENSMTTINGINIWGSPYSFNESETDYSSSVGYWAFGYNDTFNKDIYEKLSQTHERIDLLVTHEPPRGILDTTTKHGNLGSEKLLEIVQRINPRVSIYGHMHSSYGSKKIRDTTFINCALFGQNLPISFEI
jgi:Icc-related predicted phosphoesterase